MITDSKIKDLKRYIKNADSNESEKLVIDVYEENIGDYDLGVICNSENNEIYETYIYLSSKNCVISCLLYKKSWQFEEATIYFKYLKEIVLTKNIDRLLEECKKNSN